ncbi:MAG: GNAT family N-acetyltransferase [Ignavibacteria bacterium]
MSARELTSPAKGTLLIRHATTTDIPLIQQLTSIIWPATYSTILSRAQITYMLDMMYSDEALRQQIEKHGHEFILCYEGDEAVGFASFSPTGDHIFKLHKIYVLPNRQGRGIGRFMIDEIVRRIREHGAVALELNVNRQNPARFFYEHLGFSIIREEDIDIGNGYWMNDYVMRLSL